MHQEGSAADRMHRKARSHLGIPQMKADFNEHCVSTLASSHPARTVEGTSHLWLLTQRNAGAERSYLTFLCSATELRLCLSQGYRVLSREGAEKMKGGGWISFKPRTGLTSRWGGGPAEEHARAELNALAAHVSLTFPH